MVNLFKVVTLPDSGDLVASSIYFCYSGQYIEVFVTGDDAVAHPAGNSGMITQLINSLISSTTSVFYVPDIASRNSLQPSLNVICYVVDATGDPSVSSGSALYVYEFSTQIWHKIFDNSSIQVSWDSIINGPTSSPANIDDAVSKRHTHSNKVLLDELSNSGNILLLNGSPVVSAGQGVKYDGSNNLTLNLSFTQLVSPAITVTWNVYVNSGGSHGTLILTSNNKNINVESGSLVTISATYLYPNAGTGQGLPVSVSGSWGTTLPAPNTSSSVFNNEGVDITSNSTYSTVLAKPQDGLVVVSNKVQFPSGNDTTSDSCSVTFLQSSYFGYSSSSILSGTDIKNLGNKLLQSSRSRTLNSVTAGSGLYTYYCYPAAMGDLTSIIQNGSLPVLGAFTKLTPVTITTDSGVSVLMNVYKSNATNAFSNATLVIS